jgi:branched-chain amino acid transport system ATP-binding protein
VTTQSSNVLQVEALIAGYEPGAPIVNGADLTLSPGEILTVLVV